MVELVGLFAASFAAATLFPLPSEAALFAYLRRTPSAPRSPSPSPPSATPPAG